LFIRNRQWSRVSGTSDDTAVRDLCYATTKAKGTGLGLAIVKKIVEEHHGKIQIENLKTGGAAIRISLPVFAAGGENT